MVIEIGKVYQSKLKGYDKRTVKVTHVEGRMLRIENINSGRKLKVSIGFFTRNYKMIDGGGSSIDTKIAEVAVTQTAELEQHLSETTTTESFLKAQDDNAEYTPRETVELDF